MTFDNDKNTTRMIFRLIAVQNKKGATSGFLRTPMGLYYATSSLMNGCDEIPCEGDVLLFEEEEIRENINAFVNVRVENGVIIPSVRVCD